MPGGEGMPAASAVGTHQELLDRVLAVRPHAAPGSSPSPSASPRTPAPDSTERAQRLRREQPADFSLLAGFASVPTSWTRACERPSATPARVHRT